jgi:para-aminobenzoate synthetase / 4-amino-4-deoxychorismate lyase
MRCRIDHSAAGMEPVELLHPKGQLEARRTPEVTAVLVEAEAAARRGHYVAGFVAYEAAPAFDPAFRVHPPSDGGTGANLPLAWFGIFAEATPVAPTPPTPPTPPTGHVSRDDGTGWACEIDVGTHAVGVTGVRDAIAKGDTYLVNYTTRFRRSWGPDDDPFELYSRLVASYGGGYHAFFETSAWAVACGSPELFFEYSPGVLTTRPMKGTAPRGRWSLDDSCQAEALRTSPKERAENVMVVDLVRNDLGRIALPGSVEVAALCRLEQHPTLWQLTSSVTAATPTDIGLAEVFASLFPSASVTGAPKISTMSSIADLERSPRGVYCGAVGFLEPNLNGARSGPTARFAVAIRTAVVDKVQCLAEFGTGGGITWDSIADQEWAEVQLKAQALVGPAAPVLSADQSLIETMAFEPDGRGGAVRNLGDHLARLTASARYFGLTPPPEMHELVLEAVTGLSTPTRVRLVLGADGIEIETSELDLDATSSPARLCVDLQPVSSTDVMLFHKTTDRRRYEDRARRHPGADDVVLVNERGEVTETTRANLAVSFGGPWYTPPLHCGLLPGIERARRLTDGRLIERVVTANDLHAASAVAIFSSLRGWRIAHVDTACRCRSGRSTHHAAEGFGDHDHKERQTESER